MHLLTDFRESESCGENCRTNDSHPGRGSHITNQSKRVPNLHEWCLLACCCCHYVKWNKNNVSLCVKGSPIKQPPLSPSPLSPLHITLRDVQVKVGTIYHWGRKKVLYMYVCGVCGVEPLFFFWQMAYSVCLWRAVWVTGKWQAGPRSKRELYWALALLFLTSSHIPFSWRKMR